MSDFALWTVGMVEIWRHGTALPTLFSDSGLSSSVLPFLHRLRGAMSLSELLEQPEVQAILSSPEQLVWARLPPEMQKRLVNERNWR